MKKCKAVIFDLDGTLIDSMGVWEQVDVEFLKEKGLPVPKDIFEDLKGGNSFIEIARYFKDKFNLPESIEKIIETWTNMVKHHYQNEIELKPGVLDLLKFLKSKNIKIGIGSSNSLFLVKAALKNNNVLSYFDAFATGEEEVRGKPFPDIFLNVAKRLDIKPEDCIVVEDVLEGVIAAKNANMYVFAIYDKHSQKQKTIEEKADFYSLDFKTIQSRISEMVHQNND
ncbi:MAG: HAD family phosphatase [Candidatus Cloacimonadota bacterium]|nr:HAD family phosphatase [Candidatus Cloacimonadota bacterium]